MVEYFTICYYIFLVDNADEEFGPDPPPMPETPKKGKKRKAGKEPVEKKEKKQKKEKKKKKGKVDEALVNDNVQLVREIQEVNNFYVVKESKRKKFCCEAGCNLKGHVDKFSLLSFLL